MDKETQEIIIALKKAHTHLGRVIQMVEDKKYCVDIIQQDLAVIGLLRSANSKLLKRHLGSCFSAAMKGTNEKMKEKMIDEILQISSITNK